MHAARIYSGLHKAADVACHLAQVWHSIKPMNSLSFRILASPDTNDHELRILIDGEDILGKDFLGLDPPSFFSQENIEKNGQLFIGRCSCGVEGCCDYPVNVVVNSDSVLWKVDNGLNLKFDKAEYLSVVSNVKVDYSWEDIKRRVERLTTDILRNTKTKDNYYFEWTSARIEDNKIVLSYRSEFDQKLFYVFWDGQTDANATEQVNHFLSEELYGN